MTDSIDDHELRMSKPAQHSRYGKCSHCGMYSNNYGKCPFCDKGTVR